MFTVNHVQTEAPPRVGLQNLTLRVEISLSRSQGKDDYYSPTLLDSTKMLCLTLEKSGFLELSPIECEYDVIHIVDVTSQSVIPKGWTEISHSPTPDRIVCHFTGVRYLSHPTVEKSYTRCSRQWRDVA